MFSYSVLSYITVSCVLNQNPMTLCHLGRIPGYAVLYGGGSILSSQPEKIPLSVFLPSDSKMPQMEHCGMFDNHGVRVEFSIGSPAG